MTENTEKAIEWQLEIWDTIADLYENEIDRRFEQVVDTLIRKARLGPEDVVLDLGTGTGSVALAAAQRAKHATGVDLSPSMLAVADERAKTHGIRNVEFRQGRGEEIPADEASCDVVLSSLCLMYVLDREKAALEIARVLRPGGRFAAAVWAGPEECDIVRFQATAGSFAPAPPTKGVGPGALADPTEFLAQLNQAGIEAEVQSEVTEFEFPDFDLAWDVLAGVTTADLETATVEDAKTAVRDLMWPEPSKPLRFRNLTRFIAGTKAVE